MNAHTGTTYELGEDFITEVVPSFHFNSAQEFRVGADRVAERLEKLLPLDERKMAKHLGRPLTADERAAAGDLAKGQSIIQVPAEVAYAQRLGQRELERRRARRKQQRESRRRNR